MQTRHYSRASAIGMTLAAFAAPYAARAALMTSLTIAGVPEDSITPVLYALQSGIFQRHNLDVKLEAQRSGSAVAAGVAGGSYGIGKSSLTALITAHAKGIPFVLVAPGGIYDTARPTYGLVVRANGPLHAGPDFNGKTVAVGSLGDLTTISTRAWVDASGGDSASLKLLEFPQNAVAAAIEAGRIDAGAINVPDLQTAIASPELRVLAYPMDAIASRFLYTGWFATVDFVKANKAAVAAFASSLREAAQYTNAHFPQTVDLISKFSSVDPGIVAKMNRVSAGTSLDPRLVQPTIEASARYKLIASTFAAKDMILAV